MMMMMMLNKLNFFLNVCMRNNNEKIVICTNSKFEYRFHVGVNFASSEKEERDY